MNLNSILIGSDNPKELADYYSKLFGPPVWEDSGYTSWQLGDGFLSIGAHDQVKGKNVSPGRVIWNIETDDVRGEFKRMKDAGGIVVTEPYNPGVDSGEGSEDMLIATFADPDDNYFQLMSPMPAEG